MFRLIAALIVTVLPVLATPGGTDRGFEAHPMDILDNNGDPGNFTMPDADESKNRNR